MNQMNREPSKISTLFVFAIAAMLTVSFVNIAHASAGGCGGGMRHHMQRMPDALKLNDQQRQQFKQIHRSERAAGMTLHDAMQDNREAMQKLDPGAKNYSQQVARLAAKMGDLVKQMIIHHAAMRARVYAILTPDQRLQAARLKRQHARHGRGGAGHGDRHGPAGGRY